jgi:hypothetical protein
MWWDDVGHFTIYKLQSVCASVVPVVHERPFDQMMAYVSGSSDDGNREDREVVEVSQLAANQELALAWILLLAFALLERNEQSVINHLIVLQLRA